MYLSRNQWRTDAHKSSLWIAYGLPGEKIAYGRKLLCQQIKGGNQKSVSVLPDDEGEEWKEQDRADAPPRRNKMLLLVLQ